MVIAFADITGATSLALLLKCRVLSKIVHFFFMHLQVQQSRGILICAGSSRNCFEVEIVLAYFPLSTTLKLKGRENKDKIRVTLEAAYCCGLLEVVAGNVEQSFLHNLDTRAFGLTAPSQSCAKGKELWGRQCFLPCLIHRPFALERARSARHRGNVRRRQSNP